MKKNYIFYCVCLIHIIFSACKVPNSISQYNDKEVWQNIHYNINENILQTDTAFLMVSNRIFDANKKAFAEENIDTHSVHYLYISKSDTVWNVHEIKTLEEGIKRMPNKNWVLYTEGMGKIFTNNMERAYLMSNTYHVNVILFDYASINSQLSILKNYYFSYHNAVNSAKQYYHFLKNIQQLKESTSLFANKKVSIFLHSMGNLVFQKMIKNQAMASELNRIKFIDNIIFNAADVNRKNHNRWIGNIEFAKNIIINYNTSDTKLMMAMLISGNRKMGSKPLRPYARNADYTNLHKEVGNNHSYFLNIPNRTFRMNEKVKIYFEKILNGQALKEKDF